MKIIKYKFVAGEINHGTEEEPNIEQILQDKEIICHTKAQYEANLPIAEKEAIPGTLDPDPEGEFDPEPELPEVPEGDALTADEMAAAILEGVNEV